MLRRKALLLLVQHKPSRPLTLWIWLCTRRASRPASPFCSPNRSGHRRGRSMLTAISTAFHKGSWGMWPILFTSVVTIAIIVERAVYLFRASVDKDKLL